MKEYITNCPCCNRQFKIAINEDSGEISTVFFVEENQVNKEFIKQLEEKGIYFG